MIPVARAAMAVAVWMVLPSCSLLVDLSGTTGGSDAGSSDGPRAETAHPGSATEAGTQGDGESPGVDAGAGGDGSPGIDASDGGRSYPPGSWCAANAQSLFFCDDFDDGPLGSRWTSATLQVSGAATLSSKSERSAPYGFDIACPSLMPSTFLMEVLTESIPAASRVAVAFDFDPVALPADGHGGVLYLATITQGPGTPRWAIQFRAGTSLADLQEQVILASGAVKGGTGQWESSTPVQLGTWTRVEMDVDFTTSPATTALLLGGQTVAAGTLDPGWTRAPSTLELGDWYIPAEPAFEVAYDNVTIALTP